MKLSKKLPLPSGGHRPRRRDVLSPLHLSEDRDLLLMMTRTTMTRLTMWECHSVKSRALHRKTMATKAILGCPPN